MSGKYSNGQVCINLCVRYYIYEKVIKFMSKVQKFRRKANLDYKNKIKKEDKNKKNKSAYSIQG